jgi:hypothetical protein
MPKVITLFMLLDSIIKNYAAKIYIILALSKSSAKKCCK